MVKQQSKNIILVVERDTEACQLICSHLESEGYQVCHAQNKAQALAILEELTPTIIIADLFAPSVGGSSFISQVHGKQPEISFIALCDNFDEESVDELLQVGVLEYLGKQHSLPELSLRVKSALGLAEERRGLAAHKNSEELLLNTVRGMNAGLTFEDTVQSLFTSIRGMINCERIGVALFNKATGDIVQRHVVSSRPVRLGKGFAAKMHNTTLEITYLTRSPRILNDLPTYLKFKPDSISTRLMVEEGFKSSITLPLVLGKECLGFVFFSSLEKDAYAKTDDLFFQHASTHMALALSKGLMVTDLLLASVQGLAEMGERRDRETGEHMRRLAEYSGIIGEYLLSKKYPGLDHALLEEIYLTAPLHDVGKVMVPDAVLCKPSRLTGEEFEIIKKHTTDGYEIIQTLKAGIEHPDLTFFDTAAEIAYGHHECFDGSGYPQGLQGNAVPISARIVALADVFDALISKRRYKEPFSLEKTEEIMVSKSGTHFEPVLVEAFLACRQEMIATARKTGLKKSL